MPNDLTAQIDTRIDARFSAIESKLDTLTSTVLTLAGSIAPRAEVTAALDKRVSTDYYAVSHKALEDDLRALSAEVATLQSRQQNALMRAAPWVAIGLSTLGFLASSTFALASITVTVLIAVHALG